MIRIATTADISAILSIYGPYVLNTAYTFEYTVPTPEEFAQRFCGYTRQFPWLVWEENGQVLGYAYASAPFSRAAYQWCCEVSVYLHYGAQGRGIGSHCAAARLPGDLRTGHHGKHPLRGLPSAPGVSASDGDAGLRCKIWTVDWNRLFGKTGGYSGCSQ